MGKQNMYDHTIGVPFVIAGPSVPVNRRLDAQIDLRDIFPTLCEFARAPTPRTVEGHSLKPLLFGAQSTLYPETYACWHRGDSSPIPTQRMVRTDRWKLIHYAHLGRYQLFDLTSDPHERNDLAELAEHSSTRADLQHKLAGWFGEAGRRR